jgi:NADPH2:quinone reductase
VRPDAQTIQQVKESMMRALITTPDAPAGIELREVPDPVPQPDEVLIRVAASSLHRGELRLLPLRANGWRPGQDIAGVVEATAADGSGPAVGTRIVALADQQGWAELIALPADRIAALPDAVSFAEAATLPVSGTTALRTLRFGGSLVGRRVLVTGASGAVGRVQVQLAALQGAAVSAVASARHEAELGALGASEVVASPAAATGLFDLVTESVGGASLGEAIAKAAPGATVVVFGSSSGEPTPIGFRDFSPGHEMARLQIFQSYASGPGFGADLGVLASLIASGRLRVETGLEVPWTELPKAIDALSRRAVSGKAILHIPE